MEEKKGGGWSGPGCGLEGRQEESGVYGDEKQPLLMLLWWVCIAASEAVLLETSLV